jgi:excisionase family DNA binding protein
MQGGGVADLRFLPLKGIFSFSTYTGGKIKLETRVLTPKEVSRLLNIHPSTPYKWAKRNAIPFFRIGEKCLRFRKSDIELFIGKGRDVELRYRKKRFW